MPWSLIWPQLGMILRSSSSYRASCDFEGLPIARRWLLDAFMCRLDPVCGKVIVTTLAFAVLKRLAWRRQRNTYDYKLFSLPNHLYISEGVEARSLVAHCCLLSLQTWPRTFILNAMFFKTFSTQWVNLALIRIAASCMWWHILSKGFEKSR